MSVTVEYRKTTNETVWTVYPFATSFFAYCIQAWLNGNPTFQKKGYGVGLYTEKERSEFFTTVVSTMVYMTFGDREKVYGVRTTHFGVAYETENWVVVTHQIRLGEEKIWLFFYRESNGKFRHVEIPGGCTINNDGVITANYYNRILIGRSGGPSILAVRGRDEYERWPSLLINPELYFIREDMAEMLVSSDTNPLTGLIRSPGPMRTLAHQVAKQVEGVLEKLEKL